MWLIYLNLNIITWQHLGIIITLFGTYLLTISVKIKKQKGYGIEMIFEDGSIDSPTNTYIDKKLFKFGLVCVALGALLQW